MVYIQGTDTCGHRFWEFKPDQYNLVNILAENDLHPELESDYRRFFANTIVNYYIYADELVGRLLEQIDRNTVVLICSDHGFGPYDADTRGKNKLFSGSHVTEGSIIISGPGIKPGVKFSDETPPAIWDVVPTILTILDLPLAEDMPGLPILDAFDDSFVDNFFPQYVESYNIDYEAGELPELVPVDAEYEERLRSLGYIQ